MNKYKEKNNDKKIINNSTCRKHGLTYAHAAP